MGSLSSKLKVDLENKFCWLEAESLTACAEESSVTRLDKFDEESAKLFSVTFLFRSLSQILFILVQRCFSFFLLIFPRLLLVWSRLFYMLIDILKRFFRIKQKHCREIGKLYGLSLCLNNDFS